jgi:hypothetical protein
VALLIGGAGLLGAGAGLILLMSDGEAAQPVRLSATANRLTLEGNF